VALAPNTPAGPADGSSRDTILDAAEERFARFGFTGTGVKDIAIDAGVNVALLYYYFRDKEGLYHAVLARAVEQYAATIAPALTEQRMPADAVAALIRLQSRALAANPRFARLLARELIDHDAAHARPQLASLAATLFRRLCDVIEQGQRLGVFRSDLDPRFAAISSVAQMIHFVLARPAIQILLAERPIDAQLGAAFTEHAAAFALAALSAPTSADPQADGA
jgi:TetR/AcrR family transcriptional regulator